MIVFVDIDETICSSPLNRDYTKALPLHDHIDKVNQLFDEGNKIVYWTARGAVSGLDWRRTTTNQLNEWGCKYHELVMGTKPHYDLLICDKTKRIEEI